MKRSATLDAYELTSRDDIHPLHSTTRHDSWGVTVLRRWKVWYQHTVLLSGARYTELHDADPRPPSNSLQGWRFASLMSCILVGLCLCLNLTFGLYVLRRYPPREDGIGEFDLTTCDSVLSTTTKIHVGINILATALVSASNYNMQCLTAPSRANVDSAHRQGRWLDIGINSVHNLRYIPKWKSVLWLALLSSTLPLHLLWNSAVFSTTTSTSYAAIVVARDFLQSSDIYGGLNCTDMESYAKADEESYAICWTLAQAQTNKLASLPPRDCIERYSDKIGNKGFNLVVVITDNPTSASSAFPPSKASLPVLGYFDSISYSPQLNDYYGALRNASCEDDCSKFECYGGSPTYQDACDPSKISESCYTYVVNGSSWDPDTLTGKSDWICNTNRVFQGGCSLQEALQDTTSWKILPEQYEVDHCLTSDGPLLECKLQYSSTILYLVIACNAIKFVAITSLLLFAREPILATMGDAVASFLSDPDPKTKGKCLFTTNVSKSDVYGSSLHWDGVRSEHLQPLKWERSREWREKWHHGARWSHVFLCMLLQESQSARQSLVLTSDRWLTCLVISIHFLRQGIHNSGASDLLSQQFGTKNVGSLVSASSYVGGSVASILTTSICVNLPQVLFASLYFTYNSIYTCMTSAYEWSMFAKSRKSLRVTTRVGHQRSSYWLQLPFKFSIPLLVVSTTLHWLISQSIFLINLTVFGPNREPITNGPGYLSIVSSDGLVTAVGYSPLAMICAISVGFAMILALLIVSQFNLKPGMPLVGSNSFAISAACHAPDDDKHAATSLVMWGAISHQDGGLPGHCCFTSHDVDQPRVGEFYAGSKKSS